MSIGEDQEKIIAALSKSYFFDLHVYENLKQKNGKNENELADLLVLINGVVVFFQIKSRDKTTNGDEQKWFENKVIKKANSQHRDCFFYLKTNPDIIFQNMQGEKIKLTSNMSFQFITIFVNDRIDSYTNYHESKVLGLYPIVSLSDFTNICNQLVTPFDIATYLGLRSIIMKKYDINRPRLLEIEMDEQTTVLLPCGDSIKEQNILDIYISREFINGQYRPEYYKLFKELVSTIKPLGDVAYKFLAPILSKFNRNKVFDLFENIKQIQDNNSNFYYVWNDNNSAIAFVSEELLKNKEKTNRVAVRLASENFNKVAIFRVCHNGIDSFDIWDL